MLPNTPNLQLPQWESTDDFEYSQVNAALLATDTKATVTSYSTAGRPVGTERFDGRIILDTTLNTYLKWNAAEGVWRSIDYNQPELISPLSVSIGSGMTVTNIDFTHKNGIAQIYGTFSYNAALGAGDIGNVAICNVPVPWRPRVITALSAGAVGPMIQCYLNTSGALGIGATAAAIAANTTLTFAGTYILT